MSQSLAISFLDNWLLADRVIHFFYQTIIFFLRTMSGKKQLRSKKVNKNPVSSLLRNKKTTPDSPSSKSTLDRVLRDAERACRSLTTLSDADEISLFHRLADECVLIDSESCVERIARLDRLLDVAHTPLLAPLFALYFESLQQTCLAHFQAYAADKNGAALEECATLKTFMACCWRGRDTILSAMGQFAAVLSDFYACIATLHAEQVRQCKLQVHIADMLAMHSLVLYHQCHFSIHHWVAAGALLSASAEPQRFLHENISRFLMRIWTWLLLTDNALALQWRRAAFPLCVSSSLCTGECGGGGGGAADCDVKNDAVGKSCCENGIKSKESDYNKDEKDDDDNTYTPILRHHLPDTVAKPLLIWMQHAFVDCKSDEMCSRIVASMSAAAVTLFRWLVELRDAQFCALRLPNVDEAERVKTVSLVAHITHVQTRLRRCVLDGALRVARMATEGVALLHYSSLSMMADCSQHPTTGRVVKKNTNPRSSSAKKKAETHSALAGLAGSETITRLSFSLEHACATLSTSFLTVATPFQPTDLSGLGADTYGVHLQKASTLYSLSVPIEGGEYDDWTYLASLCLRAAAFAQSRQPDVVAGTEEIVAGLAAEVKHRQREFVHNVGKNIAISLALHTATKLVAAGKIVCVVPTKVSPQPRATTTKTK